MIVLMRTKTDCEVASIATATGKTYEESKKALSWRDLWSWLENPVFGNPWNLYLSLIWLGFWKRNIVLNDLLSGNCIPGKTVVLVHDSKNSNFSQHWVVWGGVYLGMHLLYWGDSKIARIVSPGRLKDYFLKGNPNCAFEVYRASIWRIVYEKIKSIFL